MSTETKETRQIMNGEPPKAQPAKMDDNMPFLDHLEELRWRIIKGFIGIVVGIVIAFVFSGFMIDKVLLGPAHKDFFIYHLLHIHAENIDLQSRKLPGQFFAYWGTLAVMGAIIAAPYFFYQFYAFIEPALESDRRRKTKGIVAVISFLFILGVAFGYLILTPFALQFFTQFKISDLVRNYFDINEYFSSMAMWIIACGVIFQMPMVTYFLTKIGILTPEFLKKYRRHAIVVCFILGAALTPPDPLSQALVAIPLIGLFQLSIFISKVTAKRRDKEIFGEAGRPT
ncbi:MAG TPA: twin-arginine translocase subunit TatC [Balneolales bacterium]|nr:twin-arginine translocase subunit TatC [Balneolales bacterium]